QNRICDARGTDGRAPGDLLRDRSLWVLSVDVYSTFESRIRAASRADRGCVAQPRVQARNSSPRSRCQSAAYNVVAMSAVPVVLTTPPGGSPRSRAHQRPLATAGQCADTRAGCSANERALQLTVVMIHIVSTVRSVPVTRQPAWGERKQDKDHCKECDQYVPFSCS